MSVSTGSTAQSSPSHIKWLSTSPSCVICLSWRLYQLLHHVYCATSRNLGLCVSAFPCLLGRLLDKLLSYVLWTFHYYFCWTAAGDMLCIDNSHSLHTKSRRCYREHGLNLFVWEWVFPVTIPVCEAPLLTLISVSASGVEISVSIHSARLDSVTKMWGCVCLGFSGPWGAWSIG